MIFEASNPSNSNATGALRVQLPLESVTTQQIPISRATTLDTSEPPPPSYDESQQITNGNIVNDLPPPYPGPPPGESIL